MVIHNTLGASDYGLLDERTFRPQAELLGRAALASADGNDRARRERAAAPGLHVYAHCHPGVRGAVSVLAINIVAQRHTR